MHLFIASCLLIACGIVDATFYYPRAQSLNQLNQRRQRSIGLPYPYGYNYNPIEPSIDFLDNLSDTFDSKINTYKPIHHYVKMSTHDANSVPMTYSYDSKNSLYDSEYITAPEIPSLLPEDSHDYKYFASPLYKYRTQPLTPENDIDINLVAIRKTSVLDYGFPTYKTQSSDSVLNLVSKYPHTHLSHVLMNPETSKVSSPTVVIVELLPETLEQESTTTTSENPFNLVLRELLLGNKNALKNSVQDEVNPEMTQETPTENKSNPITSEEILSIFNSHVQQVLEENLTEGETNSLTTEETQTEDESNSIATKDESNFSTTEETQTEDELNYIATKDESNFSTTEETQTEDESNSITTENEPNSFTAEDKSNFIITEETQTENNEQKFMTSQEIKTDFKQLDETLNMFSPSVEHRKLQIKEFLQSYNKYKEQMDDISAEHQSNLASVENTNQELQPQLLAHEVFDTSEEYM